MMAIRSKVYGGSTGHYFAKQTLGASFTVLKILSLGSLM